MTTWAERLQGVKEDRALPVSDFELRTVGDSYHLDGYASVFDAPYDIYGGPDKGGFVETVDQRAFDVTLRAKPDVHLLINHEGLPLARTKSGTLTLTTDKKGLRAVAQLDRRDTDVQNLAVKMERGDIDEMSFAFRTINDVWTKDDTHRTLTELSLDKGDVSIVNFGANPATSAKIRSLSDALALFTELDPSDALAEVRALDGDPIATLTAVRELLGRLISEATPAEPHSCLSVASAKRLIILGT